VCGTHAHVSGTTAARSAFFPHLHSFDGLLHTKAFAEVFCNKDKLRRFGFAASIEITDYSIRLKALQWIVLNILYRFMTVVKPFPS
jgi:hypothetical protein